MSENNKDATEAEVISEQVKTNHKKQSISNNDSVREDDNWNVGKIFWGLLFIVIGALVLLGNFNVITVDWGNLWRLWPIMIILCGLSILSFKNWIWRIATIVLILATMAMIVVVATSNTDLLSGTYKQYDSFVQYKNNEVSKSVVNIEAGASNVDLDSKDQDEIVTAKLKSSFASLTSLSTINDGVQTTNLGMDTKNSQWFSGSLKSDFDIYLDRSVLTDVVIRAGASSVNVDTTFVKLNSLSLKSGASSIDIKLGSILDNSNIAIESGVSSITIKVPTGVGLRLSLESGLASNKLNDLSKVDDNTYESADFANSIKKINIVAKIGVSSFDIERY